MIRTVPACHCVKTDQRLNGRRSWFLHQVECVHHQRAHASSPHIASIGSAHRAECGIRQKGGQ